MQWIAFKVIMFLVGFLYLQGYIMPQAMENNDVPLWINILLISSMLTAWMIFIDFMVWRLTKDNPNAML